MKKRRMPFEERRQYYGIGFLMPWIIGVSIFFLYPLISSVYLIFCDVGFSNNGLTTTFTGFKNIRNVYFTQAYPIQCITQAVGKTLVNLILITVLSLFIAVLLNQQFKGRAFARTMFSIPVIVASGVLMQLFKADLSASSMVEESSTIFQGSGLEEILLSFGLSSELITSFVGLVNNALDIIWRCGVQILLFLSGMQSIPGYLNEVSDIDGATAWQKFWKITFPLVTPFLIINAIYTIVDSSTYYDNPVMKEVGWKFDGLQFGYCNTLSFGYGIVVVLMVFIVYKILARRVVYLD